MSFAVALQTCTNSSMKLGRFVSYVQEVVAALAYACVIEQTHMYHVMS
jgi:hypothetical protein